MVAYSHLAVAAAQAELGEFDEAWQTLRTNWDKVSPGYLSRMESDLAIRNVHSEMVAALRSAIDKVQCHARKTSRLRASIALRPVGAGN